MDKVTEFKALRQAGKAAGYRVTEVFEQNAWPPYQASYIQMLIGSDGQMWLHLLVDRQENLRPTITILPTTKSPTVAFIQIKLWPEIVIGGQRLLIAVLQNNEVDLLTNSQSVAIATELVTKHIGQIYLVKDSVDQLEPGSREKFTQFCQRSGIQLI